MSLETTWLPKLPVPRLEQTVVQYLEAVRVVADDDQYLNTKKLVEDFSRPDGPGPKLQQILLERQHKEENWAYQWWLNDMYMNNAAALPVNSNPGMAFPMRAAYSDYRAFLRDVAAFISAILDYKELIDRQLLPQDRALSREKGQALCMAQYQRLFTSYRVPGTDQDALKSVPVDDSDHVIVAHKGQFWRLDVRHKGKRLSTEQMIFNLTAIVEGQKNAPASADDEAIGILTSENRRRWAQCRHLLLQDQTNARSLQCIESSCMLICIDQPLPVAQFNNTYPGLDPAVVDQPGQRDDTNRALQMLHGGGSSWNSINRWFDKTIQFIFSPDGASGICYEHSPAEGIVLVQMIETALQSMGDQSGDDSNHQLQMTFEDDDFPNPKRLTWKIDDEIRRMIDEAKINLDRLVDDLDFKVYRFAHYGKNVIKKFNVSPDVYIQLMLQLTYYKLHGKLVSTYESASTRRFQLGRVDCIRSASLAALSWVSAMIDPLTTDQDKIKLFYKAAEIQTDVMIRNILGQGIDIHLLGLRQAAVENDFPADVFQDPSYTDINHFALSTSQIPTTSDSFMGYGPVVPDGYGCSYNPRPDGIVFCVSTFRACEATSSHGFVQELATNLDQVRQLLEQNSQEPTTAI